MNKVVVVGASVVDVLMKSKEFRVLKSHEVPGGVAMAEVLGGKIEADTCKLCSGGGGSNVAVGLKRLGEAVKILSRIGGDYMGSLIVKELEENQLDLELLQRGKGETGVSSVLITSSGLRSIVTYRGESLNIESRDIDWELIKKADWLQVSSLGGRMDLLTDLIDFCFNVGVRVGINPGKAELQSIDFKKLLPKVDFLSLNKDEASKLTGISFDDEKLIYKKISSFGPRVIAITDGKRGACLIRSGNWWRMNSFPDKSIDDTGAGDAFVSGAVWAILNYKNEVEILKAGLASGSSVVTYMGAKDGLLNVVDMNKRLKKKLKIVEGLV